MGEEFDFVYSCGVLTISDKGSQGEREDTSGEQLKKILRDKGFEVAAYQIVPDEKETISSGLIHWVDQRYIDMIITTGGTGPAPSDVTPEATREVIEKELPGLSEAMRMKCFEKTPHAILSRGIAGIRKKSLIINLPGSAKGASENLEVILPVLSHALYKIKGGEGDCGE